MENNNTVFVDTGAWFALADNSDKYHESAVGIYPQLLSKYPQLTTTNLVIAETYILIRRTLGHPSAIKFLQSISASPRIIKIYSDKVLEEIAEDILKTYQDQNFSYTDAVSFAVMQAYGLRQAFSFDKHFRIAGFMLTP
jgi:predicted nucleic acid-binding protein